MTIGKLKNIYYPNNNKLPITYTVQYTCIPFNTNSFPMSSWKAYWYTKSNLLYMYMYGTVYMYSKVWNTPHTCTCSSANYCLNFKNRLNIKTASPNLVYPIQLPLAKYGKQRFGSLSFQLEPINKQTSFIRIKRRNFVVLDSKTVRGKGKIKRECKMINKLTLLMYWNNLKLITKDTV